MSDNRHDEAGGRPQHKSALPAIIFGALAYVLLDYWQVASLLTVIACALWFGPLKTYKHILPMILVCFTLIYIAERIGQAPQTWLTPD